MEQRVKDVNVLIVSGADDRVFRQLKNEKRQLQHGDRMYHFWIGECPIDYDIVVVRNKYIKHNRHFNVAPQNTILALSEPLSVVDFPKSYRDQFGMLHSCQEQLTHKNIIYGPAVLCWYAGMVMGKKSDQYSITYDMLNGSALPPKKKLMSVITSNKAFTKGHYERIKFVSQLKEHYGDMIDVFGRGFRSFDDKWDVLADYKYHVVIENSSSKYYWTEKLSDCYLAGCYPIYYGCTNAGDYFSEKSFSQIDIRDLDGAIKIIDDLIENDVYSKSVDAIIDSRQRVLDDYNMFNIIANCCDKLDLSLPKTGVVLKPAKTFFDLHNMYESVIGRNYYTIKSKFLMKEAKRRLES